MDAFSVCLEDMETWLMESESVADQRINLADAEQINNLLTAVKVPKSVYFFTKNLCIFQYNVMNTFIRTNADTKY